MSTETNIEQTDRPARPAMLRGWRRKCPKCGAGDLFKGFLKVRDECAVCHEEFHHQRADDGPAYLTILIVGHILGFAMHISFTQLRPDPLLLGTVLSVLSVALALYLLPRIKGAFVGLQWAKRMHGFGIINRKTEAEVPVG
ncbi:MAG: DUF983 domain-containing protein [Pseudoruegeria sp.]